MRLREEYQHIDLEKTIKNNIKKNVKTGVTEITVILQEHFDKIHVSMENIRRNNLEETYVVLYLLIEKMYQANLKLELKGVSDGILFQPSSILLEYLILGKAESSPCSIGMADNIDRNCIVINVTKENSKKVKNILDSICMEWDDLFVINNI